VDADDATGADSCHVGCYLESARRAFSRLDPALRRYTKSRKGTSQKATFPLRRYAVEAFISEMRFLCNSAPG